MSIDHGAAGKRLNAASEELKRRWTKSKRFELVQGYVDAPLGGATGGECWGMIISYLLEVEKKDLETFDQIREPFEEMLDVLKLYGHRYAYRRDP